MGAQFWRVETPPLASTVAASKFFALSSWNPLSASYDIPYSFNSWGLKFVCVELAESFSLPVWGLALMLLFSEGPFRWLRGSRKEKRQYVK